jgi:hypothetical protein
MTGPNSQTSGNVLQEYLSLLNDAASSCDPITRDSLLLRAWGVFRYILTGPMDCERCGVQVRLAIPITSERFSGETLHYACLCTNCTFKELELATRIVMQVGNARVEYPHERALSGN